MLTRSTLIPLERGQWWPFDPSRLSAIFKVATTRADYNFFIVALTAEVSKM